MSHKKTKLLRWLSILAGMMAIFTLIPYGPADDVGMLGYKSLCPFAPMSTFISLYLFLTIHRYLANTMRKA